MKRKELLSSKEYNLNKEGRLKNVTGVYIIPSRRKHESGWTMMNLIATFSDGREPVLFSQSCDDICFEGLHFRLDCTYPEGIIHIWNSSCGYSEGFEIYGCSSITLVEKNTRFIGF